MNEKEKHPKGKGCWYKIYISECVLCGRTDEERVRMWTPKPKDYKDRIDYDQYACNGHFI